MSTSLQIKIATLLGYVILSTTVVVISDDNMPSATYTPATAAQQRVIQ